MDSLRLGSDASSCNLGSRLSGSDLPQVAIRPTRTRGPAGHAGSSDGTARVPHFRTRHTCGVSPRRRGAGAILATDVSAVGREVPSACAGSRRFGGDLQPGDGRDQAGHGRLCLAALAARIPRADVAIRQPPRLGLAHHDRQGPRGRARGADRAHRDAVRRRPLSDARAVGHGVGVRRRCDKHQIHAPGHSRAGGAGLGRAAPARLLGAGAPQRARHHRARMGQRERNGRLMGRRHGSHAVDAGGLAQHGRRRQRRWPDLALRLTRRRICRDGTIPHQARRLSAR